MSEYVKQEHINYEAIMDAYGGSYGQEWFFFFKCPACNEIYLYDKEIDIVFLNPIDLNTPHICQGPFSCTICGASSKNVLAAEVTLDEVKSSKWSWAIKAAV